MSQAEELLNSLTEDEIAAYTVDRNSEPHIVVNPDRSITVPAELKNIAVQFDHNVETVTFDCPRFWDEHDLSTMQIFVIYLAPGGEPAHYPCDDVTVDVDDESIMHFTWTISGNVTEKDGPISFLICAKASDEHGNLANRWNSRLNQEMSVLKGMDASGEIQTLDPDILTALIMRIVDLEGKVNESGTGSGSVAPGVVTQIDFSNFENGWFTETVDDEVITHNVTFDEQNRPITIDGAQIVWGSAE